MNKMNILCLLPMTLVAACTTSSSVDPRAASTLEVLHGGGIENYLAERRLQLAKVQQRVDELDQTLIFKMGQLRRIEKDLAAAQKLDVEAQKERDELLQLVTERQREADEAISRAAEARAEKTRLEALRDEVAANPEADAAERQALEKRVAQLEQEVRILDRAIERSLKLRTTQLLSEENAS